LICEQIKTVLASEICFHTVLASEEENLASKIMMEILASKIREVCTVRNDRTMLDVQPQSDGQDAFNNDHQNALSVKRPTPI
jgi:hypothetical protein